MQNKTKKKAQNEQNKFQKDSNQCNIETEQ